MRRLILTATLLALVCLLPMKGWAEVISLPQQYFSSALIANYLQVSIAYADWPAETELFGGDHFVDRTRDVKLSSTREPNHLCFRDRLTDSINEQLMVRFSNDSGGVDELLRIGPFRHTPGIDLAGLAATRTILNIGQIKVLLTQLPPIFLTDIAFDVPPTSLSVPPNFRPVCSCCSGTSPLLPLSRLFSSFFVQKQNGRRSSERRP